MTYSKHFSNFFTMSFVTFLTVFLIASTFAEEFQKECPTNIKAIEQFDFKKYLGKWFEVKKYNQSFKDHKECVHYEFLQENDGSIRFLMSSLNKKNFETNFVALSFPNESQVSGKLSFSPNKELSPKSSFWILETDYLNYAIVYDCEDNREKHSSEGISDNFFCLIFLKFYFDFHQFWFGFSPEHLN